MPDPMAQLLAYFHRETPPPIPFLVAVESVTPIPRSLVTSIKDLKIRIDVPSYIACDVGQLENVQETATVRVPSNRRLSYTERLRALNLLVLE